MSPRNLLSTARDEQELLSTRVCDLALRLNGTPVSRLVEKLYEELRARSISFQPHVWLADEWFSPDGSPGIAIPFYLAHPRLIRLEKKMMLHAEGAAEAECMRILRHEAGHAIATAYQLYRTKSFREVFGLYSQPYPSSYRPRPNSRDYVHHLNDWYAQAHPAEDFAETFAVWLTPRSDWRRRYRGWGALQKLLFIDELMRTVARKPARCRSRAKPYAYHTLKRTLRQHYARKRARYLPRYPRYLDARLKQSFAITTGRLSLATIVNRLRPHLRSTVASLTGVAPYTVDQFIDDTVARSKELGLRATPSSRVRGELAILLTGYALKLIHAGHYRITM